MIRNLLTLALGLCLLAAPALAVDDYLYSTKSQSEIRKALSKDLTAATTLSTKDCGSTLFLNSATEFATTLPAPADGCYFKFIVKAAPASASYTIVTNGGADIIIIGVNELEVDTADDGPYDNNADTITIVDSVAVVGDFVECSSDGTSYYCNGQTNADGGITTSTT